MQKPAVVRTTDLTDLARSPWSRFMASARNFVASRIASPEVRAVFETDFMGPGEPISPLKPEGAPARRYDYTPAANLQYTPRSGMTSFEVLQNLASWDPVRYCIEERKSRVKSRSWAVVPVNEGEGDTDAYQTQIDALTKYWSYPDGENTFDLWLSQVLEDSFVWDAAAIFRWPTRDGKGVAQHVPISGDTITPTLDITGRRPRPPATAFQQIIKGIPYADFTSDQMIYAVRNPKTKSVYGISEVEWLMMDINIALRRDTVDLLAYTQGNAPEGFGQTPDGWTPAQIKEWAEYFNSIIVGDAAQRSRIQWVPHGFSFERWIAREEDKYVRFSEYVIRRACAIFHVSCQPYTGQMNRATSETADDSQSESADEPLMQWIESIITREIQTVQGCPDLCFKFVSERARDELKDAETAEVEIRNGIRGLDDVRASRGQDEIGIPPFVMTNQGPMYLRGQSPEYQKKYKKFFDELDAKESMKAPLPTSRQMPSDATNGGSLDGVQPPSPEDTTGPPNQQKIAAIDVLFKAAIENADDESAEELRRWRKVAIRCVKEDRPLKRFESDILGDSTRKSIDAQLSEIAKGNTLNAGPFRTTPREEKETGKKPGYRSYP